MKKHVLSRKTDRRDRRRQWRQTFAAMLRAALIEPHQVEITHQRIVIEKLPEEFHGFRIAQLSDVHHSPFLGEEEITEAVRRANELRPDLTALTGDYISHSRDYIPGCARALGGLRAAHGVFAILGNHDHWTDGEMMFRALTDHGIRVLNNESTRIELGASYIHLAGVDDLLVRRDDLPKALSETCGDETRILLSHNPAIIREAARAGVDLVLSGHTHGGQINWRMLVGREDRKTARWLRRPSRRLMRGHAQLGSTQLYVNRGLGTVVVPLRYGCPPEITLIELIKP
ncbi:MAG: metallophosphoesterase [Acidobacteria bacterium]|nr:metallophosphoesterase [Acidobacteriota bacterium]